MTKSLVLTNRQIVRAALVVLFGFLASGALGLILQAVVNATFGASAALDSFYAAQRIPEMLFVLVAGGALGSSFIPVFARFLQSDDPAIAWRLASAVMSLAFIAALVLALLLMIFAPHIVTLILPADASLELQDLTTDLTRIMLVTVPIFSVSGLLMGILNAHQAFTFPALAAAMYNLGQIFGALLLTRLLPPILIAGEPTANLYGLAWGAVIGAALHLGVQLPGFRRLPAQLRFMPRLQTPGALDVLLLMLPRTLGLAVVQINFLVNVALAFPPRMIEGSVTAFTVAWRLMFFVLGIVGQSVGTALFPSLSTLAASGDMEGYKQRLASAIRGVLFLAVPASLGLIVLGEPVVRMLYERGAWSAIDSQAAAWALAFLAVGIAGHALLEVLSRAFYALEDTRTPVTIGAMAMIANIVLSLIFIRFVGDANSLARGAFAGLALANSITTLVEAGLLWIILRRRIGTLQDIAILSSSARVALAAAGMALIVSLLTGALAQSSVWVTVTVGMIAGAATFFVLALVLRVNEAQEIPRIVLQKLRR